MSVPSALGCTPQRRPALPFHRLGRLARARRWCCARSTASRLLSPSPITTNLAASRPRRASPAPTAWPSSRRRDLGLLRRRDRPYRGPGRRSESAELRDGLAAPARWTRRTRAAHRRQARAGRHPRRLRGCLPLRAQPALVSRAHFARHLVASGVMPDVKTVFDHYLVRGKPGFRPSTAGRRSSRRWAGSAPPAASRWSRIRRATGCPPSPWASSSTVSSPPAVRPSRWWPVAPHEDEMRRFADASRQRGFLALARVRFSMACRRAWSTSAAAPLPPTSSRCGAVCRPPPRLAAAASSALGRAPIEHPIMAQYFSLHPEQPQARLIRQAAEILRGGGLVACPPTPPTRSPARWATAAARPHPPHPQGG